ncbi:MAG: dTDP-4-dehydrorhamnose 3,5-epimerase [Candidatus Niyogibacteria bacterium]|nr:dTDP-4-dehydrorhamnose 3,5-epimerase [Candidatus Niyogibacteria bacterium]
MIFNQLKIKGAYSIILEPYLDERGFFAKNFCKDEFARAGIPFEIVQANVSLTKKKGTIRGMHFQTAPKAEDKIVVCLRGKIYDIALDLRKDSSTYGQWHSEELSEENKKMMLIPKGCAHGFQALTDDCLVQYFMSEFYSPDYASGVRWNDPAFHIEWPMPPTLLSEKDKNWPVS